MPAYKDKEKGTWYASFYYEDWTGKKVKKMKRGFPTKREALEWERTGKHLGHERTYPLQEVGALLRQAEDVRHSLQRGHSVAE